MIRGVRTEPHIEKGKRRAGETQMTLEEQAVLLGRIEKRMIERFGHFNVKQVDRQVRYFADPYDAAHMRRLHASQRVTAIHRRQMREKGRRAAQAGYFVTSGSAA